jgi:hypothetical protein
LVRGREQQACLDNSDQIGRRAGHDARYGGGAEVHEQVFLAIAESIRDDLLAVAIHEEVYRARWDDADQGGHKTLK